MSVSEAIRLFLKAVAAEKALPFEVRAPNAKSRAALVEGRSGTLTHYGNVEAMMADLDASDDEDHDSIQEGLHARAKPDTSAGRRS